MLPRGDGVIQVRPGGHALSVIVSSAHLLPRVSMLKMLALRPVLGARDQAHLKKRPPFALMQQAAAVVLAAVRYVYMGAHVICFAEPSHSFTIGG